MRAEAPGVLFLSEPYYPERRAWVDGRETPLVRGNLAFSAIFLDAGEHRVQPALVPSSFYLGLAVSAASVILLATTLCFLRWWSGTRWGSSAFQ